MKPDRSPTAHHARGLRAMLVVVLLAGFEFWFFSWFLSEPLPNAQVPLRRSNILWEAVPGVKPGMPPARTHLYMAAAEFRHLENLPQRVPIVLGALLIGGAALALGRLILRALGLLPHMRTAERVALGFGLGASGLGVITLTLGRLGALSPWPVRAGLAAVVLAEAVLAGIDLWKLRRPAGAEAERHRHSLWLWLAFWALTGPFVATMTLAAMLPTYDYDAIEYHLEGPREFYQVGRITFLEHNVYTSMPFNVEMLHLLGMLVVDDWWWGALVGQTLVACFAPAAAVLVLLAARRWGSARAGWVAGVVYLTTPWVYRIAAFPYVEGPLCYYHAALVWAAGRAWCAEPGTRARWWAAVGLLAGGAMACKYPGLISAVIPFGLLCLAAAARQRAWPVVLAFGLGVTAMIGPWLVKNVIDTGNPVYPLAYHVFGGRHWSEAREAKWHAAHGPRPVSAQALLSNVVDVAGRSDWQSPLYAALVPLALLRPGSRRVAALLLGYVAYIFLTWWFLTHRLDRFWLPLLPPAAVLAGLGADWMRGWLWTVLLALILATGIATNAVYETTSLTGFNQWTGDLNDLRTRVPRDLNPPLARLDSELPRDAKILLVGQAAVFHVNRPIVYNTVFDDEILETLARGPSPRQPYRDAEQVRQDLVHMGVDYVYVDWREIERFRSPGNYGFTAFITPALFDWLVQGGALEPATPIGLQQELYRVRRRAQAPAPGAGDQALPHGSKLSR